MRRFLMSSFSAMSISDQKWSETIITIWKTVLLPLAYISVVPVRNLRDDTNLPVLWHPLLCGRASVGQQNAVATYM